MGLIWGRQVPGRPHVGPMNFDIWGDMTTGQLQSDKLDYLTYAYNGCL